MNLIDTRIQKKVANELARMDELKPDYAVVWFDRFDQATRLVGNFFKLLLGGHGLRSGYLAMRNNWDNMKIAHLRHEDALAEHDRRTQELANRLDELSVAGDLENVNQVLLTAYTLRRDEGRRDGFKQLMQKFKLEKFKGLAPDERES